MKEESKTKELTNLINSAKALINTINVLKAELKEECIIMTPKEVCELLSISPQTVTDWSKKGILKRYKLGNRAYYKKQDIVNNLK